MPYIYPSINLIETILSDYGIIKSFGWVTELEKGQDS